MIKIRYRFLSLLAALLLFVTSFLSFSGNSTSVNALSLGAANYYQVDVTDGEIIPDIGQNAMSIHRMDGARISWYTVDGPSDAYNVWYDAFGDSNSAFDGTPTSLVITFTRESALDEIDGITVYYYNVGTYNGKTIGAELYLHDMTLADDSSISPTGMSPYGELDFASCFMDGMHYMSIRKINYNIAFYYMDETTGMRGDYIDQLENVYYSVSSLNGFGGYTTDENIQDSLEHFYLPNTSDLTLYTATDTTLDVEWTADEIDAHGSADINRGENFTDTLGGATFYRSTAMAYYKSVIPNYYHITSDGSYITSPSLAGAIGSGRAFVWVAFATSNLSLPTPPTPEKEVVQDDTQLSENSVVIADLTDKANGQTETTAQAGDTVYFVLKQRMPILGVETVNTAKYDSLVFQDTLPEQVEYVDAKAVVLVNEEYTSVSSMISLLAGYGDVSYSTADRQLTVDATQLLQTSQLEASTEETQYSVAVIIQCTVRETEEIINQGTTLVNNYESDTNLVYIHPASVQITTYIDAGTITGGVSQPDGSSVGGIYNIAIGWSNNITWQPSNGRYVRQIVIDGVVVWDIQTATAAMLANADEILLDAANRTIAVNNQTVDHDIKVYTAPYHQVTITKQIPTEDFLGKNGDPDEQFWEHGEPTFIFKLENLSTGEVRYQSITFAQDNSQVQSAISGNLPYISLSCTFDELEPGQWRVTEEIAPRYQFDGFSGRIYYGEIDPNDPEAVIFTLDSMEQSLAGRATYTNVKDNWFGDSDVTTVVNEIGR